MPNMWLPCDDIKITCGKMYHVTPHENYKIMIMGESIFGNTKKNITVKVFLIICVVSLTLNQQVYNLKYDIPSKFR